MKAKIEAVAGANLGKPALDLLSENIDIYLLELSSFHLARCNHLPAKVAALLNISSDHIDWHGSEESYYQAKYRIYREASSSVYNRNNLKSLDYIGEGLSSSFGMDQGNEDHFGTLKCDGIRYLAKGSEKLLSTHDIRLSGSHNIENILAAMSIGTLMGIPKESMIDAIKEFKGLPHRMQLIASINGVQYINDSKGTNVGAAIASVNSIEGSLILIAGGQGKGGDFKFFADSIYRNLKEIILIGEDSKIIAKEFEPLISTTIVDNLDEAVYLAAENSNKGGTVLLSPACASFDQFDSYIHRGDEFCRIVRELK
jgi:UDP-N-acetylmuramoylalanine--D-glutamate ligase